MNADRRKSLLHANWPFGISTHLRKARQEVEINCALAVFPGELLGPGDTQHFKTPSQQSVGVSLGVLTHCIISTAERNGYRASTTRRLDQLRYQLFGLDPR